MSERVQGVQPTQASAALTAIVAGMVGLLKTVIGEDLACRLLRDVWPDAPPGRTGRLSEVDH